MKFIYNNQKFRFRRQELRGNRTNAEDLLWRSLRRKKLNGLKFFRQYSVGPYVLDFYCPDIRLAIELDGEHHYATAEQSVYDDDRTAYLYENGIKVLRFLNGDALVNINAVLERIRYSADEEHNISYASPSLKVREGEREESYRRDEQ